MVQSQIGSLAIIPDLARALNLPVASLLASWTPVEAPTMCAVLFPEIAGSYTW
jgi:hypothetical protein